MELLAASAYEAGQSFGRASVVILLVGGLLVGGVFFIVALIKAFTKKTRGWVIAAVASGLIAAVALLGTVGLVAARFSSNLKAAASGKGEARKRIGNGDGRLLLEVPEGWDEMPELNGEASIAVGNLYREQYAMVIENPKIDFDGDLDDFDRVILKMMEGNVERFDVTESEIRKFGGYPARYHRMEARVNRIEIVYHMASVDAGDAFYQVMAWTLPSREAKAKDLFMEVLDSFQVTSKFRQAGRVEMGDTFGRVAELTAELLGVNTADLKPETKFVDDLGADSLDTVELVMVIEEEFGVEMSDEVAEKVTTLGDAVSWLDAEAAKEE